MSDAVERAQRLIDAKYALAHAHEKERAFKEGAKQKQTYEVNLGSPFRKGPYISVSKAAVRSAIRSEVAAAKRAYEEAEKDL